MEKNNKTINILLIIIMILVVIGCIVSHLYFIHTWERKENPEPIFSMENYPKIDGSISTLPLAEAYKAAFTGTDIDKVNVTHSKTQDAYNNLINKKVDLILTTYPSEEEQKLVQNAGIELEIVPIVKEAFVFFVNKENPIENLTLSQIQDIYSGKISNWKDVGGNDKTILAYQRPKNSISQTGMVSFVMQGINMKEPEKEDIIQSRLEIIDIISDYENKDNAIGYAYYYYTRTIYSTDKIRLLSINGIEPTYDNIKNGLYGLQTAYYAIIRKDESKDSDVRKLLNAMISKYGQKVAKEAGYVQNY